MSVQLRTLLNNKKIPYFAMKIKRKVKEGDTKITKVCSGLPDGWQKYTFEQAMEWNEKFDEKPNAMNVVIKNTNYVVVDVDDKVEKILDENGTSHQTKSTGKKLPHLWRNIHPEDNHKKTNDSNVDFGDLCYLNVYEKWNATIDSDDFPVFKNYDNYWKDKKQAVSNKVKDFKVTSSQVSKRSNYANERYLSKRISDEVTMLLDILPNKDEEWDYWWKIIATVKNIHPNLKEHALKWSKKSKKHNQEHFDKKWDEDYQQLKGLTINALKSFCQMKDREGYCRFLGQKLTMTPEYF